MGKLSADSYGSFIPVQHHLMKNEKESNSKNILQRNQDELLQIYHKPPFYLIQAMKKRLSQGHDLIYEVETHPLELVLRNPR